MKKLIGFLCMIIFSMYSVMCVHAAAFINYGDADGKIEVQSYQNKYGDGWCEAIRKSINTWNNSSANVKISVSDSSKNKMLIRKYDDTWYGLTTQTYSVSTGYTSKFSIKINSRTIKSDAESYSKFAP